MPRTEELQREMEEIRGSIRALHKRAARIKAELDPLIRRRALLDKLSAEELELLNLTGDKDGNLQQVV